MPSLDLLGRIVEVLSIPPEIIFKDQVSPDSPEEQEINQIVSLVRQCDSAELKRLHAIIDAFVNNEPE